MTGPQLRAWRKSAHLTGVEVTNLLGKDITQSTLSRWEASDSEIPQWATNKLLNTTKIEIPLDELHQLLDIARKEDADFQGILAIAIQEYLARRRTENASGTYAQAAARGTSGVMLNDPQAAHVDAPLPAATAADAKAIASLTEAEIAETVAQVDRSSRPRRTSKP